jgi:hypothetical protein
MGVCTHIWVSGRERRASTRVIGGNRNLRSDKHHAAFKGSDGLLKINGHNTSIKTLVPATIIHEACAHEYV